MVFVGIDIAYSRVLSLLSIRAGARGRSFGSFLFFRFRSFAVPSWRWAGRRARADLSVRFDFRFAFSF